MVTELAKRRRELLPTNTAFAACGQASSVLMLGVDHKGIGRIFPFRDTARIKPSGRFVAGSLRLCDSNNQPDRAHLGLQFLA